MSFRMVVHSTVCLSALCWVMNWSVAVAAEPTSGAIWPGLRGEGSSWTSAKGLPYSWELRGRARSGWTIRLPGYGQSSPVVWGQRVFITTVSGEEKEHLHVLGIALEDGAKVWQADFAGTQRVPDSDTVSRGAPTPVVDDKHVFALFESGDMVALTHDGETVWNRSLTRDYGEFQGPHGYGSSPVAIEDRLIIQVCHGGPSYVAALSKADGATLWKTDHPSETGWSTPALFPLAEGWGVIVSSSGSVRAYDCDNGRELWSVTKIQGNSTPTPTVAGDVVVIGGSSERLGPPPAEGTTNGSLAIRLGGAGDVSASHVVWKSSKVSAGYASPLVVDGLAYFVNRVGGVFCVEVDTGEIVWQHRLPGSAWSSPVHSDGHLVFFCKDGDVVTLKAGRELEVVGESSLSATDIVYGVAAVDEAWIVRTGRGLIRISAPTPAAQ